MPKQLSKVTGDAVIDLEQFVVHAAVNWETYWILAKSGSFVRFKDVFNQWLYWYLGNREAAFLAALTDLSKFFENNAQSVNINHLLQQLAREKEDWSAEIKQMQSLLAGSKTIVRDLTLLRSNYYIHKSKSLTFKQTHSKTSSRFNDVRAVIETARQCLNIITKEVSGQEVITDEPVRQISREMNDILERLKQSRLS
jgi:hypothetical protein